MVCFRYVTVNTAHKGDNMDNNNNNNCTGQCLLILVHVDMSPHIFAVTAAAAAAVSKVCLLVYFQSPLLLHLPGFTVYSQTLIH